ncbi:Hypothetical protein Cp106_1037 [Corynebacterium pseudotuberculosis 1/06-A]|nr:Hypothetical protein Cp106_1037 [Corynebacterium pseudotuberculosis 1/06-A]
MQCFPWQKKKKKLIFFFFSPGLMVFA